ncbi:MAG: SPOR domain-containing protein [Armatimonadota bacterium]|nr:SPOR domain-containing protein [Armatimonadota bacterium]
MAWWSKIGQVEENPRCKTCGLRVWPPKPFGSAAPGPGGLGKMLAVLTVLGLGNALGILALFLRPSAPAPPMLVPTLISTPPPPVAAATPTPRDQPPSVSLHSSNGRKPVVVGAHVVLTARSGSSQSDVLVLSYRMPGGKRARLSLADGRLCSAVWTPTQPGRYQFFATATDPLDQTARSKPLVIAVDGPAQMLSRQPTRRFSPLARRRLRLAAQTRTRPSRHAHARILVAAWKGEHRLEAVPRISLPDAPRASRQTNAPIYHVVAGTFPRHSNATVFAQALRERGYAAAAYVSTDRHGKVKYVVETGAYARKDAAQREVTALQKTGYPAHSFVKRPPKTAPSDVFQP